MKNHCWGIIFSWRILHIHTLLLETFLKIKKREKKIKNVKRDLNKKNRSILHGLYYSVIYRHSIEQKITLGPMYRRCENNDIASAVLLYRVAQKLAHFFVRLNFIRLNFHQILTDFQTHLTVWIRRTFVIILSLKIPPHLKCVATLTCEMSMS